MDNGKTSLSALQMAAALGDRLPRIADLPAGGAELAEAARDLAAAINATDVDAAVRLAIAEQLQDITRLLRTKLREPLIVLARNENGVIENLTQAGWGRWNPQALRIRFDPETLLAPEPGKEPRAVEVTANCTLTEAHSGPPNRAHGGVVMTLLDEALGVAAMAAGAGGMTAGLNVRFKGPTPLGVELTLRARYTHSEGRKRFITGEVLAGDVICAQAEGIYIAPLQPGA